MTEGVYIDPNPFGLRRSLPARPHSRLERSFWAEGSTYIAGVDEVGRGCVAGPVVAAAVILPRGLRLAGLDDSKRLDVEARQRLSRRITKGAVSVGFGVCESDEIDDLNILGATIEAMRRALANLAIGPDAVLIDGNARFSDSPWPVQMVAAGDRRSRSIAAASIVAKVHRDALMKRRHENYPRYGWDTNVGYSTADHLDSIRRFGRSPEHRLSFQIKSVDY